MGMTIPQSKPLLINLLGINKSFDLPTTASAVGIDLNTGKQLYYNTSSLGWANQETITASYGVFSQLTGSLSGTIAGNPFIKAGSNITANYNSLGQWEITGSGGMPTSWVDEISGSTGTQTLQAGAVTHGITFLRLRPGQQGVGVRFWWNGGVGSQTVDITLYEYSGNLASAATSVASGSISCDAQGIYSVSFDTPYTLVAGKMYAAAWYNANYWSDYASLPFLGRRDQVRFRDFYLIDGGVYKSGGGAANPNVTLGVGTTNVYLVEPLISG